MLHCIMDGASLNPSRIWRWLYSLTPRCPTSVLFHRSSHCPCAGSAECRGAGLQDTALKFISDFQNPEMGSLTPRLSHCPDGYRLSTFHVQTASLIISSFIVASTQPSNIVPAGAGGGGGEKLKLCNRDPFQDLVLGSNWCVNLTVTAPAVAIPEPHCAAQNRNL